MDIAEIFKLVCLAGLVLIPYTAVMAAFFIASTQAKQQSARRIMKALARDAFADLETPKNSSRFRVLAGLAFFGVLGFTCSLGGLALQSLRYYLNPGAQLSMIFWVTIGVGLFFGGIGTVAGFLMNREINRRL